MEEHREPAAPGPAPLESESQPLQPTEAGLGGILLRAAAATGVTMGVIEVGWAYLLPRVVAGWHAALPLSAAGLGQFYLAAVATDVILMVMAGLAAWGFFAAGRRVLVGRTPSPRRRFWVRFLLIAGALAYFYVGWMALFVLPGTAVFDPTYVAIMGAGVVGAGLCGWIFAWLIGVLHRRVHRASGAAVWAAFTAIVVLATLPVYSRYARSITRPESLPIATAGERPNVLLITLDTLRFDYLGCYGNRWIDTPALDALAEDGVLFENAISQAPTTAPSHCSIMTGVYPPRHRATNGRPMRPDLITIADVLGANGYETIAFTSSTTTRSINTGLQQGFGQYVDSLVPWSTLLGRDEFQNLILFYVLGVAQKSQIGGEVVTRRALAWLDGRPAGPFFAWLHYFDPHEPYLAPEPYRDKYRGRITDQAPMKQERERYAGEVAYTDAQVRAIVAALRERGLYDDTLIIIASDHGEAFGEKHWEYTEFGHGKFLYDTTQHVPLIVKPAGGQPHARRVGAQVQLVDIFPTVLDCLDVPAPNGLHGQSFKALLAEGAPWYETRPARCFNIVTGIDLDAPERKMKVYNQVALRTPKWKYIGVPAHQQVELYDLAHDPQERHNRAEAHPTVCATSLADLHPFLEEETPDDPTRQIAPSLMRQLQSLGYLGGQSLPPQKQADESD